MKKLLSAISVAAAVVLTTLTPACAESGEKYVALGDSFAAGVGISHTLDQQCSRSDRNYAHLFAARRGYALTDVTCGGATTDTVTGTQLSAVTAETALVTLGVGGNDIGFPDIVTACVLAGLNANTAGATAPGCKSKFDSAMPARLAATTAKLSALVADIHARAPRARIVLVGYPKILPDKASACSGRQQVLPDDVNWARDTVLGGLNTMLRAQSGTEYFSTYELYEGHDVCAEIADRWVNGVKVENGEGTRFHPNQYGHAATAEKMASAL